jgi:trehalose 6-phosphate phosphatase
MEQFLSAWPLLLDKILNAKHVLFLSDFDGTLTPIVEKPELAVVSEDIRGLLQDLASRRRFTVGIISGRALADLKSKVNVKGIIYAGNHGFEIEGPGLRFVNPIVNEIKPLFRIIRHILTLTLGTITGVLVEDKGITLSVHYRQVEDEKAKDVIKLIERTINGPAFRGLFKVTTGKKVYEIRPAANWNKGKAIQLLMKRFGKGGWHSGLFPVYFGDDLTDEDGFRVIERYGNGATVHIGEPNPNSIAHYNLKSPDEVHYFLEKLLDCTQREYVSEQCLSIS